MRHREEHEAPQVVPEPRQQMSAGRKSHSQRLTDKLVQSAAVADAKRQEHHHAMSARQSWKRVCYAVVAISCVSAALFLAAGEFEEVAEDTRILPTPSKSQPTVTANLAPTNPSFQLFAERDTFTGKLLQYVRNKNEYGQSIAVAIPDQANAELDGNLTFLMDPAAYICFGPDDKVLIEYVYVANGVVSEPGGMTWSVAGSRKAFILAKGYYSDVLFQTSTQADEIRFRYTDRCGETKTLSFTTDGIAAAVKDLAAR